MHNQHTNTLRERERERGETKQDSTHLVYDRIEDFSSKQVAWYRELSIDEADTRVVGVFDVEAGEVEHVVCERIVCSSALRGVDHRKLTVIFDTRVVQLIRFTKGVHYKGMSVSESVMPRFRTY